MLTLLLLLACGGPSLDGQHDDCTTTDDCADSQLECLQSDGDAQTCEVACAVDDDCPLHQTCELIGSYGDGGVCYEGPA